MRCVSSFSKLRKEKVAAEGSYSTGDAAYDEEAELERALHQSRAEEEEEVHTSMEGVVVRGEGIRVVDYNLGTARGSTQPRIDTGNKFQPHQTPNSCLRCPVLRLSLSPPIIQGQTPQSHPNPGNSLILSLSVSRSRRDASFLHWLSSHRAVSRSPVAAPRTMPCLLLPAPPPRSCLIASVRRSPHRKDRFLRPRTRRRPRLWRCVSMTEMARVGSGGESAEVGVPVESDPMLRGEESPGPRREASRWAPVEATLNRMVKVVNILGRQTKKPIKGNKCHTRKIARTEERERGGGLYTLAGPEIPSGLTEFSGLARQFPAWPEIPTQGPDFPKEELARSHKALKNYKAQRSDEQAEQLQEINDQILVDKLQLATTSLDLHACPCDKMTATRGRERFDACLPLLLGYSEILMK
nr:unnamed protein product [Digitaria exilis]